MMLVICKPYRCVIVKSVTHQRNTYCYHSVSAKYKLMREYVTDDV